MEDKATSSIAIKRSRRLAKLSFCSHLGLALIIPCALIFAIASKDFGDINQISVSGSLWRWITRHTAIHDQENFDWEVASLCDPNKAYIDMGLLPDYTIDRYTLLSLLRIIRMCSP